MVPGVSPGKWLDRWQQRRPDVPFTVDVIEEAGQIGALETHQILFARTDPAGLGADGAPVRGARGLLTIPLYEEQPVLVAPADHDAALVEEFPLAALAASELLDLSLLGYEQAVELAGNGAGVVVIPQAVARALARRDTVVRPLSEEAPEDLGLASASGEGDGEPGVDPETIARLSEPTRVWLCFSKEWQDALTGENHPVIEEFIGIVRGRKEESSRQPSVLERQQEEAKLRLKKRQSSETTKPAARGQKSSSQRSRTSGGAGSGRRPSKGRGKR